MMTPAYRLIAGPSCEKDGRRGERGFGYGGGTSGHTQADAPGGASAAECAETGLRVIEALGLVKNVRLTEETVRKLRAAAR